MAEVTGALRLYPNCARDVGYCVIRSVWRGMESDAIRHHRQLARDLADNNPEVAELQFVRDDPEGFLTEELCEGFNNHTFRVKSRDGNQTFVVKHATSTAKENADYPLPRERALTEYNALCWFHDVQPGCSPRPYCVDKEGFTVAMEDLGKMTSSRQMLLDGHIDRGQLLALSEFISRLHNKTSRHQMSPPEWARLEDQFRDVGMRAVLVYFVFHGALHETSMWNEFNGNMLTVFREAHDNPSTSARIAQTEAEFSAKSECLIHGDLHNNSIVIRDGKFSVLDMEFACLGPRACDLSFWVSDAMFSYFHHYDKNNTAAMEEIKEVLNAIMTKYLEVAKFTSEEKEQFMHDLHDISACYIMRMSVFSGLDFIFPVKSETKCLVMRNCIRRLQVEREVLSVSEFLDVFLDTS